MGRATLPGVSALGSELTELVTTGAQQMVAALRRAAVESDSVEELTEVLRVAYIQRNQIDSALTRVIGALDLIADRGGRDGELTMGLSCATWLAHNLQISSGAAHAQVQLARQLPGLPATAAAFERGELSGQHASVVARSVEHVARGGGDAAVAEELLLLEAKRRDPRNLLRWGLGLLHRLAPIEMESEEERRHRRRYLRVSEAFDGGYDLEGYLDPIAGAKLKTALNGVLGPRAKGDERTPSQRRADALDEIVTRVLDSGQLPVRGGQRPHLTVTAGLETLRGDPGAAAALLDWGFPISGKSLRRIAQDAEITPIVLGPSGDPLRVGRRYRTATPKMRRALAERDRRCVWPGCDRPPEWTQGDHSTPWEDGGETNLEEMRLLCTPHHRLLHKGWRLERLPDGLVIAHPPPSRSGPSPPPG